MLDTLCGNDAADYVAISRGLAIGSRDRSSVTWPGECTNFFASLVTRFASWQQGPAVRYARLTMR